VGDNKVMGDRLPRHSWRGARFLSQAEGADFEAVGLEHDGVFGLNGAARDDDVGAGRKIPGGGRAAGRQGMARKQAIGLSER
jgi:hypothetical protein